MIGTPILWLILIVVVLIAALGLVGWALGGINRLSEERDERQRKLDEGEDEE